MIIKRAKLRAMHLLNDMDRTESQLRTKLRQSCYTEDVVEAALAYVKSFGYIDDLDYAKRYIQNRQNQKSKRELYAQLVGKGIERELIELAMEECYTGEDDEIEAIASWQQRGNIIFAMLQEKSSRNKRLILCGRDFLMRISEELWRRKKYIGRDS